MAARHGPTSSAPIGRLAHEAFVSDEIGNLLDELAPYAESLDHDSFDASLVRVHAAATPTRRFGCPGALGRADDRAARGRFNVWVEARAENDYELPGSLEQMIELKHRYVECFPPADETYDTLARRLRAEHEDRRSAGRSSSGCQRGARAARRGSSGGRGASCVEGRFPAASSASCRSRSCVGSASTTAAGASIPRRTRSRASLSTGDIRITTREPESSLDGLFATMHEFGHGLYESRLRLRARRTPLARGASLGLHA